MKKRLYGTGSKIAMVIISYVLTVVVVLSAVATGYMFYYKFYFGNKASVKGEIMTNMADNEASFAASSWYWNNVNLDEYYKDKNVYYEIYDVRNDKTYGNYDGQAALAVGNSEHYDHFEKSRVDPETGREYVYFEAECVARAKIYVAQEMNKNDIFSVVCKIIEIGFSLRFALVFIFLLALSLLIALWCCLFCVTGRTRDCGVKLNFIDKLPFDLYTLFMLFAAAQSILAVDFFAENMVSAVLAVFLIGTLDYYLGLTYLLSFANRIKNSTLIKNNVTYSAVKFFGKKAKEFSSFLKYVFSSLNLVHKTIAVIIAVVVLEIISVIIAFNSFHYFEPDIFIVSLILLNILFIVISLYLAVIMQEIKQGGEKIAGGELEHKIDTTYMIGDFKSFSQSLNNINDGLQTAVNEKIKSERFKTELITNVSHDIKTPITSIVNYVDLIKKEECDNIKINEYIEVLDRQSLRLKKLVEDLVEASKASTGNLAVNLTECDVGVLLSQTVAEFEEKLKSAGVEPIVNLPQKPTKVLADGRHLWRVFDNLMNNVCKYALQGTRVYLDVKESNGNAKIIFRNISKYELNVSANELMERFVRGDSSRNTEGSGLGLSIAKSLLELQNGKLKICIDGDLFKVEIELPLCNIEE